MRNLLKGPCSHSSNNTLITSRRVDDLIDAWELEGILRAVLVEISNNPHTSFIHYYSFSKQVQG
jgi:hypothetical protein